MSSLIVYYDDHLSKYHLASHSSLECEQRVQFKNLSRFTQCVKPFKPIYQSVMHQIHGTNPVYDYVQTNSAKPNFFQKLFKIKPANLKWTCYKCTMLVTSDECSMCKTKYSADKFLTYAHLVDNKISDSDTTFVTTDTIDAIRLSISAVCGMIEDFRDGTTTNGFAIVRPPGHHASCDKSEGFCIVNNIAVCATYATKLGYKKIFIFDFDAHHGNGTQKIFYRKPNVYYASMHTIEFYPRTGTEIERGGGDGFGFNLNVIVKKKVSTAEYLQIFREKILPEIISYAPSLILVSAGFDGLSTDPMQIMDLTLDCYTEIISDLKKFKVPIGMVLEGGYNLDLLEGCVTGCMDALLI